MKVIDDIGAIAIPAHILSILPHFKITAGEIEITRGGKNYAYVLTAVVVITSCVVCIEVLSESHSFKIISMSGDTEEINQTIETLFCIISYTIMVVTGSQNAEKHFRTLNEIAKIDEFLEATGYEGAYRCPTLASCLYAMSTSVIGVAFYYIKRSQMIPHYQMILLSVYIMQLYVSSTFAVYFRIILMNVTRRIEFVNDKLRQFTRDGSRNNEENWRELSNLIEIFCKFRYITENLNAVTGVGLLFYMGYAFYTVTNQSYLAFSTLTNHVAFSEKFQLMGLSASWVIAEIVIMSVLCSSCEAISSEVSSNTFDQPYMHLVFEFSLTTVPGLAEIVSFTMCIRINRIQKKFVLSDDPENSPSIIRELRLPLLIVKIAGLLPIFTEVSQHEIGPPTKQNQFYSFFIRAAMHSLTIYNLYNMFQERSIYLFSMTGDGDNVNQYIEMLISVTSYTGTVLLCSRHSKEFLKILSEVLKLDAEIRQRYRASVRNHCEFTERTIIGIVSCQLFIIGIKYSMSSLTMVPQYFIVGFYALQNCMCSVFVILLASCLRIIAMRFEFVNMILDGYTYNMGGMRRRGPHCIPFEEDASFAFRLHNKLLKVYKILNESCSLLVASFMGYAFYTITTNTYNIFVEFTTKRDVSVSLLMYCFTWLALNTALLTLLAQGCGETTKKANTTSQILARVYGKSKDYQNIIDKFLTKSIRQEVQFTAYGFFVVDNSTLFKIFSAVTTYLVILIQFKQLEDTKLDESLEANTA